MNDVCHNCGGPKPADRFRACPDCRAEWRRASRKPGGPAETIERLTAENAKLRAQLSAAQAKTAQLRAAGLQPIEERDNG